MTNAIDHLIVVAHNLDRAIAAYRDRGFIVQRGGVHAAGTTENALIAFADGSYLELMALTGRAADESVGAVDFAPLILDRPDDQIVGMALRTEDLSQTADIMARRGVGIGAIHTGERLRPDGTRLAWRLAGIGESLRIFWIEDVTDRALRVSGDPLHVDHPNGICGIAGLTIRDSAARAVYESLFGVSADGLLLVNGWDAQLALGGDGAPLGASFAITDMRWRRA